MKTSSPKEIEYNRPRQHYFSIRVSFFNRKESSLSFNCESVKEVKKLAAAIFRRRSTVKNVIILDQDGQNYWYSRRDVPNGKTALAERF